MKKTIRIVLASILISSMIVVPALAAPSSSDLEQKQKTLEQQKSAKDAEVSQYQAQYTELIGKIDELESDIISTGEAVTKAQTDLEAAEKKADKQNEDMKLRIKFMYESGGVTADMEYYLESDSFSELVTNAEYVQNVHEYDRKKLKEYETTLDSIKDLKSQLDNKMTTLESQQTEFESKKEQISSLLESAKADASNLGSELQNAIMQAESARQEEARQSAQAQAARQQAQTQSQSQANTVGGGSTSTNRGTYTTPAASYQGQGNTSVAQAIVSAAYSQLGVPYVWGGTSPGSQLDCSGLTQYAHRAAGISIPRTSGEQYASGQIVSSPQPGDICWMPGHVAIYIGGGQMIEAPQPGDVVKVSGDRAVAYVRYW
ncbi:MAG: NlpC/P60 family protein [Suipraeoptans sp.]